MSVATNHPSIHDPEPALRIEDDARADHEPDPSDLGLRGLDRYLFDRDWRWHEALDRVGRGA